MRFGTNVKFSQAIDYVVGEWAVDIIVMSFGFPRQVSEVDEAILNAYNKGKVLFAAAGLGANNGIKYPASKVSVFCIHATRGNGEPAWFTPPSQSNSDNFCTLGVNVDSAWWWWYSSAWSLAYTDDVFEALCDDSSNNTYSETLRNYAGHDSSNTTYSETLGSYAGHEHANNHHAELEGG